MTAAEYRVQRLRTRAQWEGGLPFRLSLGGDGLALFPSPSFHAWLPFGGEGRGAAVTAIAGDECGQLLWIECRGRASGGRCALGLFNRVTGVTERLGALDAACDAGDASFHPVRLWIDAAAVWVWDAGGGRVLGFDRETLQVIHEIELGDALDVAYAGEGRFVALERVRGRVQLSRYEAHASRGLPPRASRCLDTAGAPAWVRPGALAVAGEWIWVLDDAPAPRSLRFVRVPLGFGGAGDDPCAPERCEIVPIPRRRRGGCEAVPDQGVEADWTLPPGGGPGAPRLMADGAGSLFVLLQDGQGRPRVAQFDPAGSLLGEVRLPTRPGPRGAAEVRRVEAMAAGAGGELLLLTDAGLALFTMEHVPVGASGDYYSRTLDNGVEGGRWHRVALRAELPRGTRLEVRAVASDQHLLRESVDAALDDPARLPHEKRAHVENLLGPLWETVADLAGGDEAASAPAARPDSEVNLNHDALFLRARGRYLWLKLSLSSYDAASRPAVRELHVVHPRDSYLRYLPATFQEVPGDPSADTPERDFLMRFLSLFETPLRALDLEIDALPGLFDPASAPAGFLPWLATWLNLAVEEEWPLERRRALLARAWPLFEARGTPEGLAALVEAATGCRVHIVEDARLVQPVPLGAGWEWRVGRDTFVRGAPVGGFRLGESSFVGGAALLPGGPADPAAPFQAVAHRFTVLVLGGGADARAAEPLLRRLIDENRPAHSVWTLRLVDDGVMDTGLRTGVNTRLAGARPLRLGHDTALGRAVTVSRTPPATRLDAAPLGRGFELT